MIRLSSLSIMYYRRPSFVAIAMRQHFQPSSINGSYHHSSSQLSSPRLEVKVMAFVLLIATVPLPDPPPPPPTLRSIVAEHFPPMPPPPPCQATGLSLHLRFFDRNPLLHSGPPSATLPNPCRLALSRAIAVHQREIREWHRLDALRQRAEEEAEWAIQEYNRLQLDFQ